MIQPGVYNIVCPQGTTYKRTFTYSIGGTAVNLTGYTAAMQVRSSYDEDAVISLTSASGIALGGTAGTIAITITNTQSAGVAAGQYVYDLELNSGGETDRLVEGTFTVTPEVTR